MTIANPRTTAHAVIRRYHADAALRVTIATDLEAIASEPWAPFVWWRDPRSNHCIPRDAGTVHDIATTKSLVDRRFLFDRLADLRAAIDRQATRSLTEAVAEYVELITGQHGIRPEVLLARTGLNGHDPIARSEAGRRLGVSYQRIYQLEKQLQAHRERSASPAGVWMPRSQEHNTPDGPTGAPIAGSPRFRGSSPPGDHVQPVSREISPGSQRHCNVG